MLSQVPPFPACQCMSCVCSTSVQNGFHWPDIHLHSSPCMEQLARYCCLWHWKWCWTLQEYGAWAFIVICLRLWPLHSSFSFLFAVNHWLGHGDIYHSAMPPVLVFIIVIPHERLFTYSSFTTLPRNWTSRFNKLHLHGFELHAMFPQSLHYCCRICNTFFETPIRHIDVIYVWNSYFVSQFTQTSFHEALEVLTVHSSIQVES